MTTRMILNDLLNLFYPRLCLLCQRSLMEGEEHICLHCSNHLPYTHFTDMETNPVCLLLQGKTSFVAATALLQLHERGKRAKADPFLKISWKQKTRIRTGTLAATTYRETGPFDTVDLLLPVPLHPKRMRQRGYNQSEWIAYGIRSATGNRGRHLILVPHKKDRKPNPQADIRTIGKCRGHLPCREHRHVEKQTHSTGGRCYYDRFHHERLCRSHESHIRHPDQYFRHSCGINSP